MIALLKCKKSIKIKKIINKSNKKKLNWKKENKIKLLLMNQQLQNLINHLRCKKFNTQINS